jgi:hypothetical protein
VSTEAEKKPQALTLPFRVFLKYLVPDILLLLAAVLTAFGSAYLNIRIPAALGGLINVFNDMSKSGGTYVTDARRLIRDLPIRPLHWFAD